MTGQCNGWTVMWGCVMATREASYQKARVASMSSSHQQYLPFIGAHKHWRQAEQTYRDHSLVLHNCQMLLAVCGTGLVIVSAVLWSLSCTFYTLDHPVTSVSHTLEALNQVTNWQTPRYLFPPLSAVEFVDASATVQASKYYVSILVSLRVACRAVYLPINCWLVNWQW